MSRSREHGSRLVSTCTECKQAKLRCDSKIKYPHPCSRCSARGLDCAIDAAFRRVPTRQRLNAMTKELHELRNQQRLESSDSTAPGEVKFDTSIPTADQYIGDDFSFDEPSVFLESVLVVSSVIIEAFQIFSRTFRPQYPILDSLSIRELYRSETLLFWTIVVIVNSRVPDPHAAELFRQLHEPYVRYLNGHILVAPPPLHNVKALLLLCQWPLPVEQQIRDPSWLYSGLAIQASRTMSLGRHDIIPSLQNQGLNSNIIKTRMNTWLGCFYIAILLALQLGLTPSLSYELDSPSINAYLRQQTVPLVFACQVRILLIVAKYMPLLSQGAGNGSTASLLRLLEADINAVKLEAALEAEQATSVELTVLDVTLHLYTQAIIAASPRNTSDREIMILKGFRFALRLVHLATKDFCKATPQSPEQHASILKQRCLPKSRGRSLAFATIFLLMFSRHEPDQSVNDRQHITAHVKMAVDLFRACSMDPFDEYARTAALLEVLEQEVPKHSRTWPLILTHRMGFSIVLDAVHKAAEARGKPVAILDNDTLGEGSTAPRRDGIWRDELLQTTSAEELAPFPAEWSSDFSWGFWGGSLLGNPIVYQENREADQ